MDIVINLLIWIHIIAFIAGGSNSVVGPVIAGRLGTAAPEVRAGYFGVMERLAGIGKGAMLALLVAGPLVIWLKYGGFDGVSPWFWVKMALIVVMLASIIVGGINDKKWQAGDVAAGRLADTMHKITGLAFAGVLLAAVFAFS